jgi:hypothetical protein
MKRIALKVNQIIAVTAGAGKHDRSDDKARKAKVLALDVERGVQQQYWGARTRAQDGVRIELLDEPRRRGWGWAGKASRGEVRVVSTRDCWMPWEEFEPMAKEKASQRRATATEREARRTRRDDLVARLAKLGHKAEVGEQLREPYLRFTLDEAEQVVERLEAGKRLAERVSE